MYWRLKDQIYEFRNRMTRIMKKKKTTCEEWDHLWEHFVLLINLVNDTHIEVPKWWCQLNGKATSLEML